jgi:uncharacterized protein
MSPDTRTFGRGAYSVRAVHDVRIPTGEPDITLAADLFLPEGAPRVPALVSVLPYRKDAFTGIGAASSLHWFAAHGYASILVDLRGTGSSDGQQRPPFDPGEADDGIAAVEWAAGQSWCTGAVGMWGMSYGAVMTLRTASQRPPHLRAIIPMMGMTDPGTHFIHPAYARGCLAPLGVWSMSTLLCQLLPPLGRYDDRAEQQRWHNRLRHAEPYLLDLHRNGPDSPVWPSRAIDAAAITIPALCIAGWRDLFCAGSIRAFEEISGPKKLLVGPWMHTPPHESPFHPADFHAIALRWWDRWLADLPNGADSDPAATLYLQGPEPQWRQFESWPPAGKPLRLAATAGSWTDADADLQPRAIIEGRRPGPAVGALSGLTGIPTGGFGLPLDQHDDDMRSLTFTGQRLDEPLLLAGYPAVTITIDPAYALSRLVIKLTDVDPAGRSTLITSGLCTIPQSPQDADEPARTPVTWQLTLDPAAYRLTAGHRLRLVIADDDFPRLWPTVPAEDRDDSSEFLRVTDVQLALPVIALAEGRPAVVPAPADTQADPPPLVLRSKPHWEIARDLTDGGMTVTVGGETVSYTPRRRHTLEVRSRISASALAGSPAAASIHGNATATARISNGQTITVSIDLYVTETTAAATGAISVDGSEIFCRRWLT